MAVLMIMAQQSKSSIANPAHNSYNDDDDSTATVQRAKHQQQEVKAMFHDFLGTKVGTAYSPAVLVPKTADASPAASTSVGTSSVGGRGPVSTISDLVSGPDISDRLTGTKRSNSDSTFTGSTRDGILQLNRDFPDGLHLMKMLKRGGGREQSRRSNDDEFPLSMQAMGAASTSHLLQQSTGTRLDPNVSKWSQSISMGAAVQYHPRGVQLVPSTHQVPANRFRDTNAVPSVFSQLVADEGSRTGIKGPGISSINSGGGICEKIPSRSLTRDSKLNTGTYVPEPESTSSTSRQGLTSASRQMTIFYGGQAHVFDDVHPNKVCFHLGNFINVSWRLLPLS
uniref:Protein TIFY n=1 Tax=Rhizophora mucronata TaxID=61149 RepID=A0A2P2K586_RHIMU